MLIQPIRPNNSITPVSRNYGSNQSVKSGNEGESILQRFPSPKTPWDKGQRRNIQNSLINLNTAKALIQNNQPLSSKLQKSILVNTKAREYYESKIEAYKKVNGFTN